MATIDLSWDNTAVNASGNTTGQRASKRIKAVGGAWSTSGFVPANDMAKTVNSAVATITGNRVYEFKVEALCVVGGPTINDNGIQEGIVFECIGGAESDGGVNSGDLRFRVVDFDTNAPDINFVKFALYDSTNTTLLQTTAALPNSANIEHTFTGLTPGEVYVVRVIYGALVNGVQTWSSFDSETCVYDGLIAGGAECRTYQITSSSETVGTKDYSWTDCTDNPQTASQDPGEINYVCAKAGTVTVESPDDQTIVNVGAGCMLIVIQNVGTGANIDTITGGIYNAPTIGSFPLATGQSLISGHSGWSAVINIGITGIVVPITVTVRINGVVSGTPTVISTNGIHSIGSHTWVAGNEVDISATI